MEKFAGVSTVALPLMTAEEINRNIIRCLVLQGTFSLFLGEKETVCKTSTAFLVRLNNCVRVGECEGGRV